MRPQQEKKLSTESIPSDQLNYSLLNNLHFNGSSVTSNTSPISSDTTKDMTIPINPATVSSSQFLVDVNMLQDQIITEALAAAITQSIMPNISINLQGVLMGYINLTLFKGYPAYDQNTNYEEEYHRAFVMNEIMIKELTQYCEEINTISKRAKRLQEIFEQKLMKVNQSFSAHDLSRPLEPLSQQNLSAFKPYSQEVLSFSHNNFNLKKFRAKNSQGNDENPSQQNKFLSEAHTNKNINIIGIQKKVNDDCDELASFSELNPNSENYTQNEKNRPKKLRRCAADIQKNYECPYEECKKAYGSEVSLNLHIKIKHNGGNKTERERLAKQMFLAKINGKEVPEASLNLPPGFLEQYKNGLNKAKRCREGPYSSNNLRGSQQNILIHQNSKSDTQIKIE